MLNDKLPSNAELLKNFAEDLIAFQLKVAGFGVRREGGGGTSPLADLVVESQLGSRIESVEIQVSWMSDFDEDMVATSIRRNALESYRSSADQAIKQRAIVIGTGDIIAADDILIEMIGTGRTDIEFIPLKPIEGSSSDSKVRKKRRSP
jgi:hypothetical protein